LRYIFHDVAAYTPAPEQIQLQPATMGMQQPMMVQPGSGYQPVVAQTSTYIQRYGRVTYGNAYFTASRPTVNIYFGASLREVSA